jgi:NTE family protein
MRWKVFIFLAWCIQVLPHTAWAQAPIENLVFEGAGIRGIAYCGALQELADRGALDLLKRTAGTSSGAITACLLSIGYTPKELASIISRTDFAAFNDGRGAFVGGMIRTRRHLGWYKGRSFLIWLEKMIATKTGNARITFADLGKLADASPTMHELVVVATCLNRQESIVFSRYTFPNMAIADAVRASMAIPLYFEPMIIDETGQPIPSRKHRPEHLVCVDGGFTDNFPIRVFDVAPYCLSTESCIAATLGLRIDTDEQIVQDRTDRSLAEMPVFSVSDFVGAFFYLIKETMNRTSLRPEDWERTVSISDGDIGPKVKRMSKKENAHMMECGRTGVRYFFDQKGYR